MDNPRPIKDTLLLLLAALILAATVTLFLTSNPIVKGYRIGTINVTAITEDGYITFTDPGYSRTNDQNYIRATEQNDQRWYIQFDVSTIPDGAIIDYVFIRYKVESAYGNVDLYDMQHRPSTSSDETVYGDAHNGTSYVNVTGLSAETWFTTDLGSSAASDLQSNLGGNWFAIGGYGSEGGVMNEIYAEESANDSFIIVYYHFPGDYVVNLSGMDYENGTSAGAVDVNAHLSNETIPFEVDGTEDYHFWERPIMFSWDIGSGNSRRIYTYTDNENFTLYSPETTYAVYEFDIRDYTGQIGKQDAYLESIRTIGGSDYIIERMRIQNVINDVPLYLVTSQTYTLRVRFADTTLYDFGFFVSGVDPTPILALTRIQFSDRAQISYRHITFEVTRPVNTQITINYNDTRADTDLLSLTISYRNGTSVHTDSTTNDNHQFNWASADPYTDYAVTLILDHGFYGTLTYRTTTAPTRSYNPFPSLSALGTFGPIEAQELLAVVIISVVALSFSFKAADIGGFVGLAMASLLWEWGVITWTYNLVAACFVFILAYGIIKRGMR